MQYQHTPVMLKEVLEYLDPQPGQFFIDCTLGGGGYTVAIATKVGERGKVLAIDLDEMAIENAKLQITNYKLQNVILAYGNFRDLQKIVKEKFKDEEAKFSGIVFDLGLSSAQLKDKSRGFSFQLDAPLDMRFAHHRLNTELDRFYTDTQIIINRWPQEELERILREYGEERFAGRIARKIVENRKKKPIKTTGELVEIIAAAVPAAYKRKKIHFATRAFQALRIATNKELENLEVVLPQAVELLKKGGRLVVISYHSLEDRIVKQFFKKESKNCLCPPNTPVCQCGHIARLKILTRKVVKPTEGEIKNNPRARSAKMRVAEKV
jgi:16S rRNA (cytosine1402-N4)-methyltransferase